MIPLKRVDHISMGAASWRDQSSLLQRLLGFKFLYDFGADSTNFSGCVSQVPGTGIEFEVIQPAGPSSFVQKFLDEQGPGLHHITVEVDDLQQTVAELERLGIKPFGGIQDDGEWNLTYIHPKDSGGILWQLFVPKRPARNVDRSTPDGGLVGLKRVDHVSMAVPDLEKQIAFQQAVFGMEVENRWTSDALKYNGATMTTPVSKLQFEIIAPNSPDSFVQTFLDKRRPGMHHICCEVASVDKAAEALRAAGIEPFGGIVESEWKRHTFIHPHDSGGVLFQLFED